MAFDMAFSVPPETLLWLPPHYILPHSLLFYCVLCFLCWFLFKHSKEIWVASFIVFVDILFPASCPVTVVWPTFHIFRDLRYTWIACTCLVATSTAIGITASWIEWWQSHYWLHCAPQFVPSRAKDELDRTELGENKAAEVWSGEAGPVGAMPEKGQEGRLEKDEKMDMIESWSGQGFGAILMQWKERCVSISGLDTGRVWGKGYREEVQISEGKGVHSVLNMEFETVTSYLLHF